MSPTIQFLVQLVPLISLLGMYIILVKLSALVSRLKLSWLHSVLYGLVLAATLIPVNAVTLKLGIPLAAGVALAVVINLALPAWFLRNRATRLYGQAAGVAGGIRFGAVLCRLCGALGLVLLGLLGYVRNSVN